MIFEDGRPAVLLNVYLQDTGLGAAFDAQLKRDPLDQDPRPAGFYGITGIIQAETDKLVMSCGTVAEL